MGARYPRVNALLTRDDGTSCGGNSGLGHRSIRCTTAISMCLDQAILDDIDVLDHLIEATLPSKSRQPAPVPPYLPFGQSASWCMVLRMVCSARAGLPRGCPTVYLIIVYLYMETMSNIL